MGLCFTDANHDEFTDVVAGSFLYSNPGGNLERGWKRTRIVDGMDIYFATDVDGDNDCDLIGIMGDTVYWIEANDEKATSWKTHPVGKVAKGRTQGSFKANLVPGQKPQLVFTRGKNLYVLDIPSDPAREAWPLHRISTEIEEEGLAVGDIYGDGNIDIAVAEHTDQKEKGARDNLTVVYLNKDRGRTWIPEVVERGPHSSHLGARLVDLDNDGMPEMVSFGWSQYKDVHLWKKVAPGRKRKTD
jgi:hypothetical protein